MIDNIKYNELLYTSFRVNMYVKMQYTPLVKKTKVNMLSFKLYEY